MRLLGLNESIGRLLDEDAAVYDPRLREAAVVLSLCGEGVDHEKLATVASTVATVADDHGLDPDGVTRAWHFVHMREGLYEEIYE